VTLTERGRRVTEAATEVASAITEATFVSLTAEEQRQIIRLLRKLG
jgi:DNA-binding MarR family transcriptional regulator